MTIASTIENGEELNVEAEGTLMEVGLPSIGLPVPTLEYGSLLDLIDSTAVERRVAKYFELREMTIDMRDRHMIEGFHYGQADEFERPMLLKPGAQMMFAAFNLMPDPDPRFLIIQTAGDLVNILLRVFVRELSTGKIVYQALGAASSYEKKWRMRKQRVNTGVESSWDYSKAMKAKEFKRAQQILQKALGDRYNPDVRYVTSQNNGIWTFHELIEGDNKYPYDQFNTWVKVAAKRAFIGACTGVTGTGDLWAIEGTDIRRAIVSKHLQLSVRSMAKVLEIKEADLLKRAKEKLHSSARKIDELLDADCIAIIQSYHAAILERHGKNGTPGKDEGGRMKDESEGGPSTPARQSAGDGGKDITPPPKATADKPMGHEEKKPEAPPNPQSPIPNAQSNAPAEDTRGEALAQISAETWDMIGAEIEKKHITDEAIGATLSRKLWQQRYPGITALNQMTDAQAQDFYKRWIQKQSQYAVPSEQNESGNGGNGGPKAPQPSSKPKAPEPPEPPQSAAAEATADKSIVPDPQSAAAAPRISKEKLKLVEAKLTVKGYTLDDANKVLSNLRSSTHQKFGVESVLELSDEQADEFIHSWIAKQPTTGGGRAWDPLSGSKHDGLAPEPPEPNPQSPIRNPQSPMLRTEPRSDSPQITKGTLAAIKRVIDDKWIGQGEVTTAIAELYRVNRLEIMTEIQGGHFLKGWLESYTDGEEDKPATEFQLNKIEQLHKLLNLNTDNRWLGLKKQHGVTKETITRGLAARYIDDLNRERQFENLPPVPSPEPAPAPGKNGNLRL